MLDTPRILAFSGSLRTGSFNTRLIRIAAEAARESGAEVMLVHLLDFPLPVLNQDYEAAHGLPENAKKLKALFTSHDGFMIASPEYNSSITGALKNCIDLSFYFTCLSSSPKCFSISCPPALSRSAFDSD